MNIVEAGADNSGEEPIDDVFHEHAADDTVIEFPDGEYLVNDLTIYGLSNFAMVGTGDAVLVPGDDYDPQTWIAGTNNRDVRIENFTIDNTADGVGSTMTIGAYDGLTVRDIQKDGHHDVDRAAFGFRIIEESGDGSVENLQAADGGASVGIYTDPDGSLTFRDCHVEGFENNGIYGSLGSGPVHIEGGFFRNNNVASIRLGTAGSSVTGATIRVDDPPSDFGNCRGIRIADGPGPVDISDCELYMMSGRGTGGIVGAFSGGSFDVVDTAIYVGPEYTTVGSGGRRTSYAIYVDPPTQSETGTRTIEDTIIKGGGNYVAPMRFARDANEIRNLCLEQSGHERDGIIFQDSHDNLVSDSAIDVPGEMIRTEDSTVTRNNVTSDADCEWPDRTDDTEDDETDEADDNQTTEEPEDDTTAEPDDESADQPDEEISDEPDDETADQPADETSDKPDDEPADQPADETSDEPDDEQRTAPEEPTIDGDTITIYGGGQTTTYEFTVEGSVEKSTAYDATINESDEIHEDGRVTGRTTDEPDSFTYDGVITDFSASGDLTVLYNGSEIHQDLVGTNVITIVGQGETATYRFSVDGPIQKSTAYGGTINEFDEIHDDGTVTGRTTTEPDSYSCVGTVQDLQVDGPVEIRADGDPIR